MTKLLYIESSPRKERSMSIAVARAFLDRYREVHPEDDVDMWDLWESPLPEFDGKALNAKYAVLHGQQHGQEEAVAWARIAALVVRLKDADKVLISLPMWNFGIPYKLKHLLDLIIQPGLSFSYSPESGYSGLITGKPVAVVYARGGAYSGEGAGMDFQKTYLEMALGFIGFTDIRSIIVEPTLAPPESRDLTVKAATDQARALAAEF